MDLPPASPRRGGGQLGGPEPPQTAVTMEGVRTKWSQTDPRVLHLSPGAISPILLANMPSFKRKHEDIGKF